MKTAAHYVGITFLLNFLAFSLMHIFIPEDIIDLDISLKWSLIMLGMCVYLCLHYTLIDDNED